MPSCFDDLKQHTKRANYPAVMWRGSLECNPTNPVPVGYRWSENRNGIDTVSNESCPASNEKLYLLPCGCSRKCLLVRTCSKSELFLFRQRFAVFRWLSHSRVWKDMPEDFQNRTVRENCPTTEFFLVHIFPHSEWIWTRKNYKFGYFSRSGDLDAFDKVDDDQQLSTFETINSVTILKTIFWSFP